MENRNCSYCDTLVRFNGRIVEDYQVSRDELILCDECGLKTHCFCDKCGEYVKTSECVSTDQNEEVEGIEVEITEVLCSQCQDEEE